MNPIVAYATVRVVTATPKPPHDLTYHLGGAAEVLRPALWLVMLVPTPNVLLALVQIWYWTWTLARQHGFEELSRQFARLDPNAMIMLPMAVQIVAGTLVTTRAIAALRGGAIESLRRASLLFATTCVAVAIVATLAAWSTAGGRNIRLEVQLQTTLLRAGPQLSGMILPMATYLLLRKLTGRRGNA